MDAEKPDDDTIVVLCLEVAGTPIAAAHGSMRKTCGECGTDVWLSPATAAALAGKVYQLRCPSCLPPPDEYDEVMAPTAGQIAEIRRGIGPEAAAAARELAESPKMRADALKDILRQTRRSRGRKRGGERS
jgi:hypothetical protein